MRRLIHLTLLLVCVSLGLAAAPAAWAVQSDGVFIHPEVMDIGTFYSGEVVTVSGEVPNGQDVVIEIIGPAANDQFNIKGKVGPFWMTQGKAELDGAPAMYALLLPGGPQWLQKASAHGLGLENLKNSVKIQSTSIPADDLLEMFVKLKKDQGLYVEKGNAVTYEAADGGGRRFSAAYRFPRSTSAGRYSINATTFADGVKTRERTTLLTVKEVGFIRLVDNLATNRRLAYGVMAVAIALFTGAVMGLLFKGGGSH